MSKTSIPSFENLFLIAATAVTVISVGAFVAAAGYAVYQGLKTNEQWAQFVKDHDCKVVSRQAGTTSVSSGVAIVGSQVSPVTMVSASPGSTTWSCNDGESYVR